MPWDKPPVLDTMTGHAGEFPNCRCYPEPVIPKTDTRKTFAPALPTRSDFRARPELPLVGQWQKMPGNAVIPHEPDAPLWNVEMARFEPRKLLNYSLDDEAVLPGGGPNPAARSKAERFRLKLGMAKKHAALVEKQVMAFLKYLPAVKKGNDEWGERFNVYVPVTGPNGKTVDVMTAWLYERKDGKISTRPRLINCFIDRKIHEDTGQYRG